MKEKNQNKMYIFVKFKSADKRENGKRSLDTNGAKKFSSPAIIWKMVRHNTLKKNKKNKNKNPVEANP